VAAAQPCRFSSILTQTVIEARRGLELKTHSPSHFPGPLLRVERTRSFCRRRPASDPGADFGPDHCLSSIVCHFLTRCPDAKC
jgi:hypothetical protein